MILFFFHVNFQHAALENQHLKQFDHIFHKTAHAFRLFDSIAVENVSKHI